MKMTWLLSACNTRSKVHCCTHYPCSSSTKSAYVCGVSAAKCCSRMLMTVTTNVDRMKIPPASQRVSACRGARLELRLSLTTPIKQPLIETERHENRGISRWINKTIMEQLAVHDSDVASITTRGIAPGVRLSPPRSDTYSATSIRPRYADGSASTAGQFTGVACCPAQGVVSPQGSNSGPAESSSRQTRINDAAGETTVLVEPEWTTMTELVRQLLSHLVRTEHASEQAQRWCPCPRTQMQSPPHDELHHFVICVQGPDDVGDWSATAGRRSRRLNPT